MGILIAISLSLLLIRFTMVHMWATQVPTNLGCFIISFPLINNPMSLRQTSVRTFSLGQVAGMQQGMGMGQVGGPLPNLQCHPVGMVHKRYSSDWRTIYYLSYPRYVRVHNAIHILKSLDPGSFMAKTDLKLAFCIFPTHPEDWHLLGIYWQQQYYVDLYLPFGLRLDPFVFNYQF